jgi:ATP-dependent RNA circularization protein (DNA/RNA ligase family)
VKNDFYKFPSTPHLAILGEIPVRDDKVLTTEERDELLKHELVIEEKVDGANLGISFDDSGNLRAQNRGSYLHFPYSGQWKKLSEWLEPKMDLLFEGLSDRWILFGEWCYAQHSVFYNRLPDWFIGFDIFDKNKRRFFSCPRRDAVFHDLGIFQTPAITRGRFALSELKLLLSGSRLTDKPAEGIYLRFDKGDWLEQRAKLVRPEFIQSVEEHWLRKGIRANRLKVEARA